MIFPFFSFICYIQSKLSRLVIDIFVTNSHSSLTGLRNAALTGRLTGYEVFPEDRIGTAGF